MLPHLFALVRVLDATWFVHWSCRWDVSRDLLLLSEQRRVEVDLQKQVSGRPSIGGKKNKRMPCARLGFFFCRTGKQLQMQCAVYVWLVVNACVQELVHTCVGSGSPHSVLSTYLNI